MAAIKYLLTLDVGTTSVKACVFNEKLSLLSCVIKEYTLFTPLPDIVEMPAEEYWEKAVAAVKETVKMSGALAEDIVSITCTTQGETLIPIDKNGKALSNAIVWLDARAKEEAAIIARQFSKEKFYLHTGITEINAYCPIAKLLWVKNKMPNVYKNTAMFLLLEDYLIYRLCGKFVSNPALLCSSGYFDIRASDYWDEILSFCSISKCLLPNILPCGTKIAALTSESAALLSLSPLVTVCSGAMDQVASAIGSGNIEEGIVTETTGTCQATAATCGSAGTEAWSLVTVYSHAVKDKYMKVIINQTAGIAYKWFRSEFCADLMADGESEAFKKMDSLAQQEPVLSGGVSFFPHLTGLQGVVNDDNARGVFFGVSLQSTRASFIRAIMEGVGYMLRENLNIMQLNPKEIISLGGGSKSPLWCSIKADICNRRLVTISQEESTSLGAAILGAVACGIFKDIASACQRLEYKKTFSPNLENALRYENGYRLYLAMYRQFAPLFLHGKKDV